MQAYEKGGHAYHATLPDRCAGVLPRQHAGDAGAAGWTRPSAGSGSLGTRVRALLAEHGFPSVAAPGFEAPGVVVSYTDDPLIQNGRKFAEQGLQTAAGVPLMCDEPADFRSFRLGLFGLDKWADVDAAVRHLEEALDRMSVDALV